MAYGQVYTTLQRLVRDGLATVDGTGPAHPLDRGGRRTMVAAYADREVSLRDGAVPGQGSPSAVPAAAFAGEVSR